MKGIRQLRSYILKPLKGLRREAGQAMVEFALVLPVFLAIVLGIMDIGYVTAQREMFLQGCSHLSWEMTAASLGDTDDLNSVPSNKKYDEETVTPLIYAELQEHSLFGYDENRLNVLSASAEMYNKQDYYTVPGYEIPAPEENAVSITRYIDINAELSYDIYPLTFAGKWMFGDKYTVTEEIDCTRVLSTRHRSG